ncbi:ankyrin repeat domain-containing protein SOWAHC isoform X2 [Drosophila busckii]|uniref:ankyrin repeat domain-containing protein SOWAHC isoform X2 n=1 Tax=Drosophila busckii TaxID=30019 RepID=UPI001433160B|nr:ankyrin repeat domain-containing protein SOWAHC isoform X2 [Drosophila busckii]
MEPVKHLSIADIRNYMLQNDGKVTNHALVKHFKKYLTHTQNEAEARKRFKAYVTLLSTIKNENNQKFLILRKKYFNECPSEEVVQRAVEAADNTLEPGSSVASPVISTPDVGVSPLRHPPPYKAPPEVNQSPLPAKPIAANVGVNQVQLESYRDCVNEFTAVMQRIDPARLEIQPASKAAVDLRSEETNTSTSVKSVSRANSVDESNNKENIPRFSFSSGASTDSSTAEKLSGTETDVADNPISVKEATRKFNRMASEEEAKVISPPAKKKAEKQLIEEKDSPEVTLAHPKAKEWIVSMAKANYQELAKLASEYPELVKLQDPATGFTALHWAAKHGNEDVVKLIAGTYKVDVNARTNGGYTPLHLATQFGRDNIFELLWNVYKANRDIMDWSGNKPLDYSRQRPSVSASTCSSEYKNHFLNMELSIKYCENLNGGHEISGGTLGSALTRGKKRSQLRSQYATFGATSGRGTVGRSQSVMTSAPSRRYKKPSVQSLIFKVKDEDSSLPQSNQEQKSGLEETELVVEQVEETMPGTRRSVSTRRRNESFLRKTFRSAAGASRPSKNNTANQQTL